MIAMLPIRTVTALILGLSFSMSPIASAETPSVVIYSYDGSGNRISRVKYVENSPESINALSDSTDVQVATAAPNPTMGLLDIELSADAEATALSLYSLEGTHLKDWGAFSGTVQIDLSMYPSGWYVLHVNVGRTIGTIKILKY